MCDASRGRGAEASAFLCTSAAECKGFARGREGLRLRGESFQAEFRGARRFAQQRVRMLEAAVQFHFQRFYPQSSNGISAAGLEPRIIASDQFCNGLLAVF